MSLFTLYQDFASISQHVKTVWRPKHSVNNKEENFPPTTIETKNALEVLYNFSLFSDTRGKEMQDLLQKFQSLVSRDKL